MILITNVSTFGLYCALSQTDPFLFTLNCFVNFKAMRYELKSFNRIVAYKSHHVKPDLHEAIRLTDLFVFTVRRCVNF